MTTIDVDDARTVITLTNGTRVAVKPLKTREVLKLAKIVTNGGSGFLPQAIQMAQNIEDKETFIGILTGLVITTIPEAEDEVVDFIRTVVERVDEGPADETKEGRTKRAGLDLELSIHLQNPPIDDSLDIILEVLKAEKDTLQSLGKRIMQIVQVMTPEKKATPAKKATAKKTTSRSTRS